MWTILCAQGPRKPALTRAKWSTQQKPTPQNGPHPHPHTPERHTHARPASFTGRAHRLRIVDTSRSQRVNFRDRSSSISHVLHAVEVHELGH
ncbi:hypothetical protein CEP80_05010 [Jonesia denitrificans]|nr:hypothetical protein CEP80_05010 [Jonesia denitrificans]